MECLIQNDVIEQVECNLEIPRTRHVCVGMSSAMRIVAFIQLKCYVGDDICGMSFTENDIVKDAWLIGHDMLFVSLPGKVKSNTTYGKNVVCNLVFSKA